MMHKIFLFFGLACLFFISPLFVSAETESPSRIEVLDFLKEAQQAQISISEKPRNMNEINKILLRYFSEEYNQLFLEANLVYEDMLFVTYESDFTPYSIPFFSFTDKTKVVKEKDSIYVFENFKNEEIGPVAYEEHYEGILLKKSYGVWRVSEYLYDVIPERILGQDLAKKNITINNIFTFHNIFVSPQVKGVTNPLPFRYIISLKTILNSD